MAKEQIFLVIAVVAAVGLFIGVYITVARARRGQRALETDKRKRAEELERQHREQARAAEAEAQHLKEKSDKSALVGDIDSARAAIIRQYSTSSLSEIEREQLKDLMRRIKEFEEHQQAVRSFFQTPRRSEESEHLKQEVGAIPGERKNLDLDVPGPQESSKGTEVQEGKQAPVTPAPSVPAEENTVRTGVRKPDAPGTFLSTPNAEPVLADSPGLPDRPIGFFPQFPEWLIDHRGAYPYVDLPLVRSTMKGTLIGKVGPRGVSENGFFEFLQRHFPGRVLRDHRVEFTGAKRDYEPDLILHFEEFGLRIDVEIDEPYSGRTRKPMHWLGSYDDDRDLYFSNNGWVVVRFAERQVVCQPLACIDYLIRLVNGLLHRSVVPRLVGVDSLVPVARWSWEEAARMAANKERESYLGLSFDLVEESDEQAIEVEAGLVREPNSHGDRPPEQTVRDTGLAVLPERYARLRDVLLTAIADGDHALLMSNETVFLLQLHEIVQRRARFFLRGFDVLTQHEVELELRQIQAYQCCSNVVLRSGDQSDPDKLHGDVQFATQGQYCLYIEYTSSTSGFASRTLSLLRSSGTGLYLDAWCHVRNEERCFRLDRIHSYKVLDLKRPFELFEDDLGSVYLMPYPWEVGMPVV